MSRLKVPLVGADHQDVPASAAPPSAALTGNARNLPGALKDWQVLEPGGTVLPATTAQPHTGGWRTGVKPEVQLDKCVNCLLCWLHCPDSAIVLDGTNFAGFDYDFCKGCEICAAVCPVGAIAMVAEP